MDKETAIAQALALAERSGIVMLGTNGDDGTPNIKAMLKMENEGLKTIWMGTNTASRRVEQLRRDPRASLYFIDMEKWMGVMLVGEIELLQDPESRQRLWREGFERYYPLGVTDPDYTVLRFTARQGNYYHALANVTFEIE
jgi:general stress protein 26